MSYDRDDLAAGPLSRVLVSKSGMTDGLSASPVSANGVLYFGDGSGHRLIAVDERTRKKLWSSGNTILSSAQTEAVVINGHVYETSGSNLYAFGL